MRTLVSHIISLLAYWAIAALAPLSANAQNSVKQNASTILSVEKEAGVSYIWDLYDSGSKEFAHTSGNLPASTAFFLNNSNKGASVTVQWLKSGTYFFKVTATYADGSTNNIKVGQMIVEKNSINPPIANDDKYNFECMPIQGNLLSNDLIDPNAIRSTITLLDPSWDVQGKFKINQQGMFEYTCENPLANTVDSMQYKLLSLYNDRAPIERAAMIRIFIGDVDCTAPEIPDANDDKYTISCETNTLDVTTNDSYNADFDIQIEIIEWPAKGTLEYISDTQVSYVPDDNASGEDYFKYEIYYKDYPERYDRAEAVLNIPDDLDCSATNDTTYNLFIPEAFTPNGDGVHDSWVVDGVELYPNATMTVYTRSGKKIFEHKNYGNVQHWGETDRWWNGTDANGNQIVAGVYLYTYDIGKTIIRGFVMVAYGNGQIGN
ncbi:MAG: gliding motility-associated C-terminal domain-containing protein [Mangrovibacterium sp.]